MASGNKKKKSLNMKISVFDPNPSGRFAYEVLEETKTTGVLIGRLAVWAWLPDESEHAFTKDLDVAVSRKDLLKIRAYFNKNKISVKELPIGGINITTPDGVNVDFIERTYKSGDLSPLFEKAVKESVKDDNLIEIGRKNLVLVSIEYLIAMKIATMERKDEEDAERLLNLADVNINKLRQIVFDFLKPLGPARLENILRQTGHPDAQSRGNYLSD